MPRTYHLRVLVAHFGDNLDGHVVAHRGAEFVGVLRLGVVAQQNAALGPGDEQR